jgi:flagellar biogenesis protein FliO
VGLGWPGLAKVLLGIVLLVIALVVALVFLVVRWMRRRRAGQVSR